MAKKRQITAQTRVKLSQAAKKRKRGLKGTPLAGKFLAGASPAFGGVRPIVNPARSTYGQGRLFGPDGEGWKGGKAGEVPTPPKGSHEDWNRPNKRDRGRSRIGTTAEPKGPRMPKHRGPRGANPSQEREMGQAVYADAHRRAQTDPDATARELTRLTLERHSNPTSDPSARGVRVEDFVGPSPVISRARKDADQHFKGQHWKDEGVYASQERKTPARFVKEDMHPDHQAEFDKMRQDPNSPFNQTQEGLPGDPKSGRANNRRTQYVNKLQEGYSHDEALSYIQNTDERRGRKPTGRKSTPTQQRQQQRRTNQKTRGSKFENVNDQYRGKNDMEFGVDLQSASTLQELRDGMPDAGDRDLLRAQQAERMSIQDEFEKNLMWAHETKRANLMGENADTGGRKQKEDDDRVVFFTTNLGSPAPSVPADSLVGQYIIRRRKNMMKDVGYSAASLKGEFPRAVRDMHLLELSTGISLGVEGRAGVYNETGFRKGTKTSKGYNKPTPLGSSMVTDSQGSPLYDGQGNVRYSEGATRPVNWQSPRAGLKIFIG